MGFEQASGHLTALLKRWATKHADWTGAETELVLVPVHWPGHWALGVIDTVRREIWYLDSMANQTRHIEFVGNMACFANEMLDDAKDTGVRFSGTPNQNIPQQQADFSAFWGLRLHERGRICRR